MKLKLLILAALAALISCDPAFGQATILPPGETCFSALAPTSGGPANTGTGFIGLLGTITGGSGYTNGTYGGVALTGGSGTNATANITVSGGTVTAIAILNPGQDYVVGDTLSAAASSIGGTGSGFSVPVSSVSLNYALAGGSVGFYIPNTLTYKQTWQDSGETILNTNPVTLDANGCAVIYGSGIYRMIVKDSLGNTAYDKLTASTGPSGVYWAGTAGGTGNAITVTDSGFANQDGATIQFRANANNSGPTAVSVSSGTPISVVKDTSTGPAALSGGEIGLGNTPMLTYDLPNNEFHILNPSTSGGGSAGTTTLVTPQGYLNLIGQASGDVVQTGDVTGATTLYYSPFVGSIVPIFNGTTFVNFQISELTATLTASGSPADAIQDACVFSNNGVATLAIGPSWSTTTPGSASRGTGAGTAQLSRLQGLWVNAVSITGYNGLSSYTIPASQCTYVGSVWIDHTAGEVTAYRSYGQNRKFGVWNAYNRQPIILQAGDPTSSWNYSTSGVRASDNAPASLSGNTCNVGSGTTCNSASIFTGLPEEQGAISFQQLVVIGSNTAGNYRVGIGVNSITAFSGTGAAYTSLANQDALGISLAAQYAVAPVLGVTNVFSLENAASGQSFTLDGQQGQMLLKVQYNG